jgi:Domain of unknown function (DUF1905)/Bacteriocin-protection, YdeI or OmpD-Associated
MRAKRHTFSAKLERVPGRWVTLEVPLRVSRALGKRGSIPVMGTLNGKTKFRSTLLPTRPGIYFLPIKYELRKNAGLEVGEIVKVSVEIDHEPRTLPTPEDVIEALEAEGLLDAYELVPPGRKMQFLKYLEEAVHETTRAKRIAMILEVSHAAREKHADREMRRQSTALARAL